MWLVKLKPDVLLLDPGPLMATTSSDGLEGNNSLAFLCEFDSVDFAVINGAAYIVVFILSFMGNVSIAFALLLQKTHNTVTNLYVLNVVFSDLVFALSLPFWSVYYLHHWVFGETMCKFVFVFYITGQYSSILLLTAMTVDRFKTVVLQRPKNQLRRLRCAQASCAAAWLIGIGASVGDAVKAKVNDYGDHLLCEDSSENDTITLGYNLQVSLLFFLPFAIIVFCYSAILRTVLRASNRKQQRTVVMVLCIVVVFFVCWAPYSLLLLVSPSFEEYDDCYSMERWYMAMDICRLLAFCHCCVNPVLYMSSQKLRKTVFGVLCCKNVCTKKKVEDRANISVTGTACYTTVPNNVTLNLPTL